MKNQRIVMLFYFMFFYLLCVAQVEPFTKTYDIYPDWTGEFLVSIEKTNDDGYIVAYNQNEYFDVRTSILKLDKFGEVEWHRVLDQEEFPEAESYSVCVDSNNNYYLAGYFAKYYYPTFYKDQNGFVAKYDCNGELIWAKSYGTFPQHDTDSAFSAETIYDIIFYGEDKLIVAGQQNYCPEKEIQFFGMPWLFAIDAEGNILWEWNDCNDSIHVEGNFYGVTILKNGNIAAVGNLLRHRILGNYFSNMDFLGLIGVFDDNGNLQQKKVWNFLKNISTFYDVQSLYNNDIAVVAYTADTLVYEGDSKERLSAIIFNEELEERFQYNINIGGQGGFAKISVDNDTNIFIVGATLPSLLYTKSENSNHMLIAKFDKNAELIWKDLLGADNNEFALSQMDIVADNDGGTSFCCLHMDNPGGTPGSYLFKLNSIGAGIFELCTFSYPEDDEYIIYNQNPIETTDNVSIYPNPAKSEFIIEIPNSLVNSSFIMITITGQLVANNILTQTKDTIKTSDLKNGIYIIKIQKDNNIVLKKIIVNK